MMVRLTLSLVLGTVFASGAMTIADAQERGSQEASEATQSSSKTDAPTGDPMIRGEGKSLEMRLHGRVTDALGNPAKDIRLRARFYKGYLGRDELDVAIDGDAFEIWVPIGQSHWFYVELSAEDSAGNSRAVKGVSNRALRQAAIEGLELPLIPATREVEIAVVEDGVPVADAPLRVKLTGNLVLERRTDSDGKVTLRLCEEERLTQMTAWTNDFLLGGFAFNRKPRRDPFGTEFLIELDACHDQVVRFLDEDGSPVSEVPFELIIGTGPPDFNFAAVPATFPHCRMITNDLGEAVCRWFPNWKTHGAYVEMVDPRWATAARSSDLTVADDGALEMRLKPRVPRQPLFGKVTSERHGVGGLLVEIKSFQGEQEGRSDHVYAFTDAEGNFSADCIPGATYSVCVNDARLSSKMIDLIPYDSESGESHFAELDVVEGNLIEIHVVSGPDREPIRNQRVYVRENHRYQWREGGRQRGGQGSRDYPVYTNDQGAAYARARTGAQLRINVNAGEWRSKAQNITVPDDGVTRIDFHRQVAAEREVKGQLISREGKAVDVAGAEIFYGSIDGETDERELTYSDANGQFAFRTKALKVGILAYTSDGKAAAIARVDELSRPIQLPLQSTIDVHGQLLTQNDEPIRDHHVRIETLVGSRPDFGSAPSFSMRFQAKTLETHTDDDGNYTLRGVPCESVLRLVAAPIVPAGREHYLEDFYLAEGDLPPRLVKRIATENKTESLQLEQRFRRTQRMAQLERFHLLVIRYDVAAEKFINESLLNHETIPDVSNYLNVRLDDALMSKPENQRFAQKHNWSPPRAAVVFACVLDAAGKELGRLEIDTRDENAIEKAKAFLHQHIPPKADAKTKWDQAFAEAKRTERRVWARVGQRYCGPCFLFSMWLDDHRTLLEKDYVFLKVDNLRDQGGQDVAESIVVGREHFGIPFHTIFDADGNPIVDSESPVGNIGYPSGFEGRRHLSIMLRQSSQRLTTSEVDELTRSIDD